jgi:polygalacturonase
MNVSQVSTCNVREYGALGNGQALDSPAIQAAIEACAAQGLASSTIVIVTQHFLLPEKENICFVNILT